MYCVVNVPDSKQDSYMQLYAIEKIRDTVGYFICENKNETSTLLSVTLHSPEPLRDYSLPRRGLRYKRKDGVMGREVSHFPTYPRPREGPEVCPSCLFVISTQGREMSRR